MLNACQLLIASSVLPSFLADELRQEDPCRDLPASHNIGPLRGIHADPCATIATRQRASCIFRGPALARSGPFVTTKTRSGHVVLLVRRCLPAHATADLCPSEPGRARPRRVGRCVCDARGPTTAVPAFAGRHSRPSAILSPRSPSLRPRQGCEHPCEAPHRGRRGTQAGRVVRFVLWLPFATKRQGSERRTTTRSRTEAPA
jgi:hypothetical protein